MRGMTVGQAASAALALLFFTCAALQYNDPDPWRWMGVYALAGLLSAADAAALGVSRWVPAGVAAVVLVWAASLLPSVAREAAFTGTEVERELGGLLLVSAGLLILTLRPARRRRGER